MEKAAYTPEQWISLAKQYVKLRNFDMAYECFINTSSKERQINPSIFLQTGDYFREFRDDRHLEKALRCYNWAVAAGSTGAWIHIGKAKKYMFYRHYRTEDLQASFEAFATAYQYGIPEGAYQAGLLMMHDALESPEVRETAIEWFQEALDGGIYKACSAIGRLYAESPFSTLADKKDDHKALYWFFRGCMYHDPDSLYYAGVYLFRGIAVKKNIPRGLRLLKQAAEKKQTQALIFLGKVYQKGRGVPRNMNKALSYYTEAAQLGLDDGESYAAMAAYEEGRAWLGYAKGYPFDEKKAAYYLKIAAAYDYPPAAEMLGTLYEKGIGTSRPNVTKALKYYNLARKAGIETAEGKYIRLCIKEADRIKRSLKKENAFSEENRNDEKIKKAAAKVMKYYKKAGRAGSEDGWALLAGFYLEAAPVCPIDEQKFLRAVEEGQDSSVLNTRALSLMYYSGQGPNGKYFHKDPIKADALTQEFIDDGDDAFEISRSRRKDKK